MAPAPIFDSRTRIVAVFEFLIWALVIGAVLFVGAAAYSALAGRSRRSIR